MSRVSNNKTSIGAAVVTTLISSLLTFCVLYYSKDCCASRNAATAGSANSKNPDCTYSIHYLKGFNYIKPMLLAEKECESVKFAELKTMISGFIENKKSEGFMTNTSVYLNDLTKNEWICINPSEGYHPGSLLKVVTLITYLRMYENDEHVFDKELKYDDKVIALKQTYNTSQLKFGKKYTIRELLRYMIINSDNFATNMLNKNMDLEIFKNTFADVGLSKPNVGDMNYTIKAKDYSQFFNLLYNAGCLSLPTAQFAINLLTESDFKDGILKGLPADMKVAHKFGETGYLSLHEIHESAIVYLENRPYLLTVMTKGNNVKKQAEIIAEISSMVYQNLSVMETNANALKNSKATADDNNNKPM